MKRAYIYRVNFADGSYSYYPTFDQASERASKRSPVETLLVPTDIGELTALLKELLLAKSLLPHIDLFRLNPGVVGRLFTACLASESSAETVTVEVGDQSEVFDAGLVQEYFPLTYALLAQLPPEVRQGCWASRAFFTCDGRAWARDITDLWKLFSVGIASKHFTVLDAKKLQPSSLVTLL